jgi:hypothetical protein
MTTTGDFQPLYICREGIPVFENKKSKRVILFEETAELSSNKMTRLLFLFSNTGMPSRHMYNGWKSPVVVGLL